VDARADLFSLGATMYWALSGREPYPETGNVLTDLNARLSAPPVNVRLVRPEVPAELADLVAKLTDPDPDRRYQSARAVAGSLAGLSRWVTAADLAADIPSETRPRVLLADDDPGVRALLREVLADCDCCEAEDGKEAWRQLEQVRYDLLVLDINLPGVSGIDLLGRLRQGHLNGGAGPRVLVISGDLPPEALGGLLLEGADDFLEKPFTPHAVRSRVRGLLFRRSTASLTPPPTPPAKSTPAGRETVRVATSAMTRELPPSAGRTHCDQPVPAGLPRTEEVLAFTVSRLLEEAGVIGRGHGRRFPRYVRALATAVPAQGEYARLTNPTFLDMLVAVAPLFEVGALALPSEILMKPGRLTPDEQLVVQAHTTVGSEVLVDVAAQYAEAFPCLTVAAEVVRHHHERWDGAGYPDGLAGVDIPLSARVVALVSVYDALRSRRPYRPPLTHARAVRQITAESPGLYDPTLVAAFTAASPQFDEIFRSSESQPAGPSLRDRVTP
jgi:response regulator RpfG family c-di-GMP phosphodiesterase